MNYYFLLAVFVCLLAFTRYYLVPQIRLIIKMRIITKTPNVLDALGPNERVLSYADPHIEHNNIRVAKATIETDCAITGFPKKTQRTIDVKYSIEGVI